MTLVTIRKGVTFEAGAAASFRRAETARGRQINTTFTYRSPAEQQRMLDQWNAWLAGKGPKPDFYRPISPKLSWHCKGTAFDSFDARTDRKLEDLLNEHGWYRVVADEDWHWQYYPAKDKHRGEPAGGDATPFATSTEEDEMEIGYIREKPGATVYAVHPWLGTKKGLNIAKWEAAQSAGAVVRQVSRAEIDKIPNA